MSDLVIGAGEIGKAVQEAISPQAQMLDIVPIEISLPIEVMHICFPYTVHFEAEVRQYAAKFKPEHIIVYSTVPIGTCAKIDARIVHSPIEGKHPDLALSIRHAQRWLGHNNQAEAKFFTHYFTERLLNPKLVPNTNFTEALKLLSTSEYGVNIVFAQYKKAVADALEMDYELTKQWNEEYNKLYHNLELGKKYQKFVLDAPTGPIGGHCVVPNAAILNSQFPTELLKMIGDLK